MPKLDVEFKNQIKSLSKADLEEIVIRVAGKNKEIYDFLIVDIQKVGYAILDAKLGPPNNTKILPEVSIDIKIFHTYKEYNYV